MSHAYRNAATLKRAQYVWDNMAPPEGGPCECAECGGGGQVPDADDLDGDLIECPWCAGTGYIDEDGNSFDPKQAERDRDEYADMRRERDYR